MGLFPQAQINKMAPKGPIQAVQVFGRKKTATAVAHCKRGNGLIKINGRPINCMEPEILRVKLEEKDLLGLTSEFVSRVAVMYLRSMPSDKLYQRPLFPTTRNMSMKLQRKKSRTSLFNMTGLSWLQIQDDASLKSLEVLEPVLVTRNHIVNLYGLLVIIKTM